MHRVTLTHTVETPVGLHVSDKNRVDDFLDDAFTEAVDRTQQHLEQTDIEYEIVRGERSSVIGGDVTEVEVPVRVAETDTEALLDVFSTTPVDASVQQTAY